MEGYMINKSLKELRDDIKSLSMNFIKQDNNIPIMYYKKNIPYMKNYTPMINNYNTFVPTNNNKSSDYGILMRMVRDNFGIQESDLNNINFVVFTVINLSNYQKVNNPPEPPFININDIKMYKLMLLKYQKYNLNDKIESIKNKLITELKNMDKKVKNYNFYKNVSFKNIDLVTIDDCINKANDYINIIDKNNSATLIGSLYSTDIIKDPFNINSLNLNYNTDNLKDYYDEKLKTIIYNNKIDVNIANKDIKDITTKLDKKFINLPQTGERPPLPILQPIIQTISQPTIKPITQTTLQPTIKPITQTTLQPTIKPITQTKTTSLRPQTPTGKFNFVPTGKKQKYYTYKIDYNI
jgi:hypothetical protein